MRKILMLSLLALVCAGASGCISTNPCSPGWHPGALFQRHPAAECCCDPCMSAPVVQSAPCCQ